ncbi:MAG: hypothetical protein LBL77_01500 [Endomicrobium sp.]|jgi:hypothetical protein|nr:hypothetical protein [Endomicrobium sp.]
MNRKIKVLNMVVMKCQFILCVVFIKNVEIFVIAFDICSEVIGKDIDDILSIGYGVIIKDC